MPSPTAALLPTNDDPGWLRGGGETGALIRSLDWSRTSLGALETWPQCLRTSVTLCLSSTLPILLAWGPDDIQIYNDAYRPICGDLHPRAMGGAFREVWASALPVVGNAFDRASRGEGVSVSDQRMFLDRAGYLEEAFMTFSFSPIRDESGEVGGIFHPITETTSVVLNARRAHGLRELDAALADARQIGEIALAIEARCPSMALDLPFVLLYQIEAHSGRLLLRGAAGTEGHAHLALPDMAPDDTCWPFARAARARTPQQVHGLRARFAGGRCGPYETRRMWRWCCRSRYPARTSFTGSSWPASAPRGRSTESTCISTSSSAPPSARPSATWSPGSTWHGNAASGTTSWRCMKPISVR